MIFLFLGRISIWNKCDNFIDNFGVGFVGLWDCRFESDRIRRWMVIVFEREMLENFFKFKVGVKELGRV